MIKSTSQSRMLSIVVLRALTHIVGCISSISLDMQAF
jgi:hypothetical protein